MIITFYGEHGSPDGATLQAYDKLETWQGQNRQAQIVQVSTAAVGEWGEE